MKFVIKSINSYFSSMLSITSTLFYNLSRYLLGTILIVGGLAKLIDASGLLNILHEFTFVNQTMALWIATLLPVLEIGLSIALLAGWELSISLSSTIILFGSFLGFSIYGWYTGWSVDCGCFGNLVESQIGWRMIFQNGIFLSLSAATLVVHFNLLQKQE